MRFRGRSASGRASRARWQGPCLAGAILALAASGGPVAAPASSGLRLVSPLAGAFVSGLTKLEARFDDPELEKLAVRVAFYADGRPACARDRAPWSCEWDAGPEVQPRLFRVVASLRNGSRVIATSSTRGDTLSIGSEAQLVMVTATVTDSKGHFVKGLTRESFRVLEDGAPQQVVHFIGPGSARDVVAAVDMSGSMAPAMPGLRRAVKLFLGSLRAEDALTLIAFNDGLFTLASRETDAAARDRAVDKLAAWGGTALYDAVLRGLAQLSRQKGRKALVVFTDGEDVSSLSGVGEVEKKLEVSDAPVYVIGQGRGTSSPELQRIIKRMAELSGGRAFATDRQDELERAFAEIAEELSNQYLLAYDPSNTARDGSWRTIQVQVPATSHEVRARQGYRAVSPSAARGGE